MKAKTQSEAREEFARQSDKLTKARWRSYRAQAKLSRASIEAQKADLWFDSCRRRQAKAQEVYAKFVSLRGHCDLKAPLPSEISDGEVSG